MQLVAIVQLGCSFWTHSTVVILLAAASLLSSFILYGSLFVISVWYNVLVREVRGLSL